MSRVRASFTAQIRLCVFTNSIANNYSSILLKTISTLVATISTLVNTIILIVKALTINVLKVELIVMQSPEFITH